MRASVCKLVSVFYRVCEYVCIREGLYVSVFLCVRGYVCVCVSGCFCLSSSCLFLCFGASVSASLLFMFFDVPVIVLDNCRHNSYNYPTLFLSCNEQKSLEHFNFSQGNCKPIIVIFFRSVKTGSFPVIEISRFCAKIKHEDCESGSTCAID